MPVEQEHAEDEETDNDAEVKRFEPISKDWKTNLFVSTTKRSYSMDLNLIDDAAGSRNYAHIVRYSYPEKAVRCFPGVYKVRKSIGHTPRSISVLDHPPIPVLLLTFRYICFLCSHSIP